MNSWQQNQQALRQHLAQDSLDNLLAWSTVRKTMYVGYGAEYMPYEYQTLKDDWAKWMPVVRWAGLGADAHHAGDGYASDPNLVHQAYHLLQWLDRTQQDITTMRSIVEFGAGYGAMALVCHRLGFRGLYYIIDLPELVTLQRYFLGQTLPDLKRVFWLQSQPLSGMSVDLFIACHSLCEIPIIDRERLLATVTSEEYLFVSGYEFEGVDNYKWFGGLDAVEGYKWSLYPHRENAFYMVGVK